MVAVVLGLEVDRVVTPASARTFWAFSVLSLPLPCRRRRIQRVIVTGQAVRDEEAHQVCRCPCRPWWRALRGR